MEAAAALTIVPQAQAVAVAERQPRENISRKEVVARQQERRNLGRRQRDEVDPMDPVSPPLSLISCQ